MTSTADLPAAEGADRWTLAISEVWSLYYRWRHSTERDRSDVDACLRVIERLEAARPAPSAAPREGEPNHRLRWAIDRLERLHQRVDGSVDDFCGADDQAWPCDTMVVLAAAREAARREGE
jgi:hypothetical protein